MLLSPPFYPPCLFASQKPTPERGGGGAALLYRSVDLTHWEYLHPLLTGDLNTFEPVYTGVIWECPNLLTFGEERVLLFSVQDTENVLLYPLYACGAFRDEQFLPHAQGMLVHGGYFYAPQVLRDDQDRSLMWGWLMEGRSTPLLEKAGWAGVMSLPVMVAPLPGGRLSLEPAPELATLRGPHWHDDGLELSEGMTLSPDGLRDDCLEILVVSPIRF